MSEHQAIVAMLRLSGLGVVLFCFEFLVVKEPEYALHSGSISRLRARFGAQPGRLIDFLFSETGATTIVVLRLACAAWVVVCPLGVLSLAAVWGVAVLSLLLVLRMPLAAQDGPDQMTFVIYSAVALARVSDTAFALHACLWFVAVQACLSYGQAGFWKVFRKNWRNGQFLLEVLSSRYWGSPRIALMFQERVGLVPWVSRGVVMFECVFPLALVLPRTLCVALLVTAFAFHVANAFVMRIGQFLFIFPSTYPAILYCSIQSTRWLALQSPALARFYEGWNT